MEAVYDLRGVRETAQCDAVHVICHVQCDGPDFQPFFQRYHFEARFNIFRLCAPDHGYDGAFTTMPVFVTDIRVKLATSQAGLIKGYMLSGVFREKDVFLSVSVLLPFEEAAQMVLIIIR